MTHHPDQGSRYTSGGTGMSRRPRSPESPKRRRSLRLALFMWVFTVVATVRLVWLKVYLGLLRAGIAGGKAEKRGPWWLISATWIIVATVGSLALKRVGIPCLGIQSWVEWAGIMFSALVFGIIFEAFASTAWAAKRRRELGQSWRDGRPRRWEVAALGKGLFNAVLFSLILGWLFFAAERHIHYDDGVWALAVGLIVFVAVMSWVLLSGHGLLSAVVRGVSVGVSMVEAVALWGPVVAVSAFAAVVAVLWMGGRLYGTLERLEKQRE